MLSEDKKVYLHFAYADLTEIVMFKNYTGEINETGIKIGDSKADFQNAYPDAEKCPNMDSLMVPIDFGWGIDYRGHDEKAKLIADFKDGKIDRIRMDVYSTDDCTYYDGPESAQSITPTKTTIKNGKIQVDGEPVFLVGPEYSPVDVCNCFGCYPSDQLRDYYSAVPERDIDNISEMGVNVVMPGTWDFDRNHNDFLNMCFNEGNDPIYVIAPHRTYIDFSNPSYLEDKITDFASNVENHKDHPAVIMWSLHKEDGWIDGHEEEWYTLVNECAKKAHELDPNHLVAAQIGGLDEISSYESLCLDVDVWLVEGKGMAMRGYGDYLSIGEFNSEYEKISDKPMIPYNMGIDDYDASQPNEALSKSQGEIIQADKTVELLNDMKSTSSAGLILSGYQDKLYADGGLCDKTSYCDPVPSNVSPDGCYSAEGTGLVEPQDNGEALDTMRLKPIYNAIKNFLK